MSFSKDKKKKLIVPAVALMMCAVAVIGVGFALSSVVTSQNENSTVEFIANIGDYNTLSRNDISNSVNDVLSFTVTKTNVKGGTNGTENVYKYDITGGGISYIKVKGTEGNYTLNVKTSTPNLTISFYNTTENGSKNGSAIASISESSTSGSNAEYNSSDFVFNTNKIYMICIEDIKDDTDISSIDSLTLTFTANQSNQSL